MNKEIELIQKSTRQLAKSYNTDNSFAGRFDALRQIIENISFLKQQMNAEEFEKEFGKLEKSANEKFTDITDFTFLESLLDKLKNVIDSLDTTKL